MRGLAIVTGGSRGLGAALCDVYREKGWEVLEFSRAAPHSFSARVDLSDPSRAASVFAEEFQSLVILDVSEVVAISNAAVLGPVGSVEHASPADVATHINVNVVSAILFARAFITAFQDHDYPKTFVNISSGAAAHGVAGWSLYCAGKAALESYIRAVALEQSQHAHPIRVLSVNPGVMDTSMQAAVRSASVEDFPMVERYIQLKEQGLLARPASVASRIVELVASRPDPGEIYSVGPYKRRWRKTE